MADKLIGADALTRAIVNSPSDISGYSPVYRNGVAKRQIEILDIILNMNGTTKGEIRAKAIDEFAESLLENAPRNFAGEFELGGLCCYLSANQVMEIAEQMKGGAE